MKEKLFMPLFVVLLSYTALLFAQNKHEEQALKTFKPTVNKFTEFFSTNPKLVSKSTFPDSPTGFAYTIFEYTFVDISYNIEKTNSIVSPFIGYFEVTVTGRENSSCGNLKSKYPGFATLYGYDKMDDALRNDHEKCFKSRGVYTYVAKSAPTSIKFIFAYQDDKWVFKDVLLNNQSYDMMLATLSKPTKNRPAITESAGVAYNQKWIDLLK